MHCGDLNIRLYGVDLIWLSRLKTNHFAEELRCPARFSDGRLSLVTPQGSVTSFFPLFISKNLFGSCARATLCDVKVAISNVFST